MEIRNNKYKNTLFGYKLITASEQDLLVAKAGGLPLFRFNLKQQDQLVRCIFSVFSP